jgi:hypothetical protein
MSLSDVTRKGLRRLRPGRDAVPGTGHRANTGRRRGVEPLVPEAQCTSSYG